MTHSGEGYDREVTGTQVSAGSGPAANDDPREYKGIGPPKSRPIVFIDTEYTGFPVIPKQPKSGGRPKHGNAEPVDVCAIKLLPSGIEERYSTLIQLADSHRSDRAYNGWEKVVGYDPVEWAKSARPQDEVANELFDFVQGCAWVSHGHSDVQLWHRVWNFYGIRSHHLTCFPTLCTEYLTRQLVPGLPGYNVDALCEHFDLPKETTHRAEGGAERCMRIFQKLRS